MAETGVVGLTTATKYLGAKVGERHGAPYPFRVTS